MKNKISILFASILLCAVCSNAFGQIKITEAKLGKGVENRVVTEESATFALNTKVYFWMKTSGGTGDITITWKSGNRSHNTTLKIGGDPWRTWAYHTTYATGEWTATATDDKGTVLKEITFTVQ